MYDCRLKLQNYRGATTLLLMCNSHQLTVNCGEFINKIIVTSLINYAVTYGKFTKGRKGRLRKGCRS